MLIFFNPVINFKIIVYLYLVLILFYLLQLRDQKKKLSFQLFAQIQYNHCIVCIFLVEPTVMTYERSNKMDFRTFVDKPKIVGVLFGHVSGLALLGNELFVVRGGSTQLEVYNANTFIHSYTVNIVGSSNLRQIVSSLRYKCLYISDMDTNMVHRHNLAGSVNTKWFVGGGCFVLSLTSTDTLLVTLRVNHQIKEYTTEIGRAHV